jgi:REP element-mobilizing transposase RayT
MPKTKFIIDSAEGQAAYHVTSRVVNREYVLDDEARETFVDFMRRHADFGMLEVLTYCVMSNHFHILVIVPQRPEKMFGPEEMVAHVTATLGKKAGRQLGGVIGMYRENGCAKEIPKLIASYWRRMFDVSFFMKALKQEFTQWLNKRRKRKGTMWEERFRAVLVEGIGPTLTTMAAYIDLNPVRAKLVQDPKDYRWSGYGAAVAGKRDAVLGIRRAVGAMLHSDPPPKGEALAVYRKKLYSQGEERSLGADGRRLRVGFGEAEVRKVWESGGKLRQSEIIRCRVRHFVDGAILGSREFVNTMFGSLAAKLCPKRKNTQAAKRMRGVLPEEAIYTARQLR